MPYGGWGGNGLDMNAVLQSLRGGVGMNNPAPTGLPNPIGPGARGVPQMQRGGGFLGPIVGNTPLPNPGMVRPPMMAGGGRLGMNPAMAGLRGNFLGAMTPQRPQLAPGQEEVRRPPMRGGIGRF